MLRVAELALLGFHTDRDGIVSAVIAALHLYQFAAARHCSRQTERMHRHFRSAVSKTHHLDREPRTDLVCEFEFQAMGHAEQRSNSQALFHRLHYGWMAVAGKQSSIAEVVIQILIAVDVVDTAPFSVTNEQRIRRIVAVIASHADRHSRPRTRMRFV